MVTFLKIRKKIEVINLKSWYRLKLAGVKDRTILKLMEIYNGYEDIFLDNLNKLGEGFKIEKREVEKIVNSQKIDLDSEIKRYELENIRIISYKDDEYPKDLKKITQPPTFLYIKGKKINEGRKIGVVGTRKMSGYGEEFCQDIVEGLVKQEVTIVSGLARGIDHKAHMTTLDLDGYTIAVVGCGLDKIYPRGNKRCWELIEKKGTLISEYPLGTPPMPHHFPLRNRIIAGLSKGVVVIESYESGGSLITAKLAFEENREVFVLPGFIKRPSFEGNNNLIKDNYGKLITSWKDIFIEYGWEIKDKNIRKNYVNSVNLDKIEKNIVKILEKEKNLDQLIEETGLLPKEILRYLTKLEGKRLIKGCGGGKFRRIYQGKWSD